MFCANDLTAIGAIDAVRGLGLSIPDGVAVAASTTSTPRRSCIRCWPRRAIKLLGRTRGAVCIRGTGAVGLGIGGTDRGTVRVPGRARQVVVRTRSNGVGSRVIRAHDLAAGVLVAGGPHT